MRRKILSPKGVAYWITPVWEETPDHSYEGLFRWRLTRRGKVYGLFNTRGGCESFLEQKEAPKLLK